MLRYFIKAVNKVGIWMWVSLIVGVGGLLVGMAATVLAPRPQWVPFGIMLVVTIGMSWLFWRVFFGPLAHGIRLEEIGIEAPAKVVSFKENGSSLQVGGQLPKAGVTFELDIRPPDRSPYRATTHTYVSMFEIEKYMPGNEVRVKFDPAAPHKILLLQDTSILGGFAVKQ
jgi:hypothetical protein